MSRLIIGIGNEFRGDDAVGLLLARECERYFAPPVTVKELSGEGAALMESWQGYDHVLLLDAVRSGAPAGTVHSWMIGQAPLPAGLQSASTHAFGALEAIELARTLKKLPSKLLIIGIEVQTCEVGGGLSAPVTAALPLAMRLIEENLFADSVQAPSPPNLP